MQKKFTLRKILSFVFNILIIPLTIFLGVYFLNDRKYFFISIVIILYTIISFLLSFEKRKPKVRELVIIAVLSAIAVAGRGAFFMLPQFKPMAAVVIISGICLGSETGFMVGALSIFISNFFFGQGPWTPWQMFSMALIGYFAGLLFSKNLIKKTKLNMCVFGGLSVFFIYGGIINIGSVIIFTPIFNLSAIVASYVSAFWFDIIHALSTVIFLFLIGEPMIEKIERVKTKYGFYTGGKDV